MSTKQGGLKLRYDSRDRHAHVRFGQVAEFQPESNFGYDLYSVVEPETAVSCTAYSTTKVRASQTKVQYDIDDLWQNVPYSAEGADPRATLGTAIKQGLKDFKDSNRDFGLKGYYRADTGSLDAFDNVRSAMALNQSSVMVNSYWFSEWNNTPVLGKMPIGKIKVSAHSYLVVDWKIVDGETVFLIDSHQGQRRYMSRETFNAAMKETGVSSLMPSTQELLDKHDYPLYLRIKDVCINIIILLRQLLVIKQQAPSSPPVDHYQEVKEAIQPMNKIEQWAKGIAQWEGDKTGHNAGNMKYTTLTKSWGATRGRQALDGGYFALFPDDGMPALCNFLTLACENQLIAFHQARTFEQATKVYAGNPPQSYIEGIRQILGCQLDTDISTFLS